MTLTRAKELLETQIQFSGGYNRNAVMVLLAEVSKEHGQPAVDALIKEFGLEDKFGLAVGRQFKF